MLTTSDTACVEARHLSCQVACIIFMIYIIYISITNQGCFNGAGIIIILPRRHCFKHFSAERYVIDLIKTWCYFSKTATIKIMIKSIFSHLHTGFWVFVIYSDVGLLIRQYYFESSVWIANDSVTWWRHLMDTFFRVTGHLCGEFTGPRWIPRTKACDAELWSFLWFASE